MTAILSKKELRLEIKARLGGLTQEKYQALNGDLYRNFCQLEILKSVNYIMIYYSVRKEAATIRIINYLLNLGKTVTLPVCTPERDLKAAVIKDLSRLQAASYGLMEPDPGAFVIDSCKLELIVAPGVAFDEKGHRLGHGGGYYDRFLSKISNGFKLGLAYDFQLVPEVPVESHDIKMNALLTPTRYLNF